MPAKPVSLWPSDFGDLDVLTPATILRQQGAYLGEKTKGVVLGRVDTKAGPDNQIEHCFRLFCQPLAYALLLLWISHDVMTIYPAVVNTRDGPPHYYKVAGPDALMRSLKEIFATPATVTIIASMIAQSSQ